MLSAGLALLGLTSGGAMQASAEPFHPSPALFSNAVRSEGLMQIEADDSAEEAAPDTDQPAPDVDSANVTESPAPVSIQVDTPSGPIETAPPTQPAQTSSNPAATPPAPPVAPNPSVTRPEFGGGKYTVVKGDTMFSIARKAGLDLGVLSAANNISDPAAVKAGQTLYIPARPGSVYVVGPGDTLQSIADRYQLKLDAIREANRLDMNAKINPGQLVLIPGVSPSGVTAMAAATPKPATVTQQTVTPATPKSQTVSAASGITPLPSPKSAQVTTPAVAVVARAPQSVAGDTLIWPAAGPLSTNFSPTHRGLDVVANQGTPVKAALSGRVVGAAESDGPYGWYVMLEHGGTFSTVYAHLSKIRVKVGDAIQKGQIVGEVGSTGLSTGAHLHFELRQSNVPIDPRPYLP
jgi:lipoprotein NlpD